MRKIKHILKVEVQIVLNILFLCLLFIISFAYPSFAQQDVKQNTTGDQSPNINAPGGKITVNYGISPKTIDELSKLLNGKYKEINRLLKTLDEKDVKIEEREALIQDWIRKYKELEQRLAQRPSEDKLSAQARQKLVNGDIEGAEKLLHESLEKNLQDIKGKTKAAAADAYEIGSIKELKLDYRTASEYYYQALQLAPDVSDYHKKYGFILVTLGDSKKAVEYFEKALKIDLADYGDKHPDVAIIYSNLGGAWDPLGDSKKAVEYFEKALKIDLAVYGDKHPNFAIMYANLGLSWDHLGNYKKAVEYYEKALKIDLAVYGDKHPNFAIMYANLGLSWDHLGDYKKAVEYYEKALTLSYQIYGADHPLTKTIKMNIDNLNKQK
jgi:tetratricopeptide (TPR) repeat protein